MKTRRNILIFLIITICILNACAPAYVPNVVNTPLLSEKGDINASISAGLSGYDPQFSYAVTDHIGIIANGSFLNSTSDSSDNFHKHQFAEIGIGYYTKFAKIGRFETYGGYGYGMLQSLFDNNVFVSTSDVNTSRLFIQPSLGLSTRFAELSFTPRFVMVNLTQDNLSNQGIFVEPVLSTKLGSKNIKFIGQLGFSLPLNSDEINFTYRPFLFSVGLQVSINPRFGK